MNIHRFSLTYELLFQDYTQYPHHNKARCWWLCPRSPYAVTVLRGYDPLLAIALLAGNVVTAGAAEAAGAAAEAAEAAGGRGRYERATPREIG